MGLDKEEGEREDISDSDLGDSSVSRSDSVVEGEPSGCARIRFWKRKLLIR